MQVTLNLSDEQWQQVNALAEKEGVSPEAWVQARLEQTVGAAADHRWLAPPGVPTMEEILRGFTPENRHRAIDSGPRVGREAW